MSEMPPPRDYIVVVGSGGGGVKHDDGKATFDLLPFDALAEVSKVLDFGVDRYGARNWEKGFKWLRLGNAAARHLFAWMRGEKTDPETGRSHAAHLACCALFLVAHELRGIGQDDRR
jgi:sucrose-6-phosphate hydrolase SacC (GH32 family)